MCKFPHLKNSFWGCFLIILIGSLPLAGCGGSSEPSSPGILAAQNSLENSSGRNLWGVWHVSLNPSTLTVDITPLRGAQFTCNVTRFMQPPSSPVHMLQIYVDPSSTPATGHFIVDVTLRHPFPGLNQYRGFDVRGIMMADGSLAGLHDSSVIRAGIPDTRLLNADGYTRWWNYQEFTTYNSIFGFTHGKLAPQTHPTCTVNPYKLFADELEYMEPLSGLDPNSRMTFFTNPGFNKRRYDIQFKMSGSGPVFDFNYAVDASWSLPDVSYKPAYPEEAFDLSANCNEAYMVRVTDAGSTAYYVNSSEKGGELKLDIEVFDHQSAASPNGMADEVAAIWIEGDVLSSPVNVLPTATVLPGSGNQSSVYEVTLGSLNLNYSGESELFLTVESKKVTTYEPQIPGGSAFHFSDAPLAAYLAFTAIIDDQNPILPPIVTSVVPDTAYVNKIVSDLEVHGANFVDGAVVEFKHTTSAFFIVPPSVSFISSSLLILDLDLNGASIGLYDVTVTNPDAQFGTLDDGFEVLPVVTDSIWWKSYMYNINNTGWNPTATMPDPASLQQQWISPVSGFKFTNPVVADNKIFFSANSTYWERPDMTFYCYDLTTGTQLWSKLVNQSSKSSGARVFSCPAWWDGGNDGIDRIAVGGDKIYCFNADTGDQLWDFDASYGGIDLGWWSNQMQEYNGMLLARSRFQTLHVLNFQTGELISTVVCSEISEGGCTAKDGKVYINSHFNVDCADIMSGALLWSTKLPDIAPSANDMNHWVNPAIVGNRIYVTSRLGGVYCLSIADEGGYIPGQIIWSWNDPIKSIGSTAMMAGACVRQSEGITRLYVISSGNSANVYCLEDQGDAASLIWRSVQTGSFEGPAAWANTPSYPQGVVYCPDNKSGNMFVFDASNGSLAWTYSAYPGFGNVKCGVALVNDQLVLCTHADVRVLKAP